MSGNNRTKTLSKESQTIIESIRSDFEGVKEEFRSEIRVLKDLLESRDETINRLQNEVDIMKNKLAKIEEKSEDADAYERRDTLILSGELVPDATVGENCSYIASQIVKNHLKVNLTTQEISTAHRIGPKPTGASVDRRNIIFKLCRRDSKREIITTQRRVKPQGIFINENLTPMRNIIMYCLRKMRRSPNSRVTGCTSYEGKVYAWVKSVNVGSNARDTRICVHSREN